jgi:acyl dehydratase
VGTRFPGPGTIYLSQTLKFLKPVFIGDEVTYRLKVLEYLPKKNRLYL